MIAKNINSIFITTENDNDMTQAFLFQAAREFSSEGHRVLYIAPEPLQNLPPAVNDHTTPDEQSMLLITFMYLTTKQDLLTQLCQQINTRNPAKLLIVQNMEKYVNSEFDAATVAAAMTNAAATFVHRMGRDAIVTVLASYRCPVPPILVRNFFKNVWCVHKKDEKIILKNLQAPIRLYQFSLSNTEDEDDILTIEKVFKEVISQTETI